MVKKTKKIYNIRWKKCDQNFQLEHKVAHLASLPPSKQVLLFISYQASQLDCMYGTWHPNFWQSAIAIPEIEDHGRLLNGKMLWMDETFPDEIEKIRQAADDSNKDYAIGRNVESDDGDDS